MPPPPLFEAARRGRAADVAALLTNGADVNELASRERTALYIACQEGHAGIVTTLVAANADVNASRPCDGGSTPLRIACFMGHTEVVSSLIAANVDVNQAGNNGASPLYVASAFGHTEIVTKLLARVEVVGGGEEAVRLVVPHVHLLRHLRLVEVHRADGPEQRGEHDVA